MDENPVQRRLAAILAADVVGYSRLMGEDEEGTLAALSAVQAELIEPCIAAHHGRVFKTTGDGMLAEFASVVDAVGCAIAFQSRIAERNGKTPEARRIEFRIGVNLGDVILKDDDVFGDGVNIAARLESLAMPGGICISRTVRDNIRDRMDVTLEDLGEIEVKNIARPVRVFRVFADSVPAAQEPVRAPTGRLKRLAILAVIPVAIAVAGAVVWFRPWDATPVPPGSSLAAGTSLAVLPFADLGQRPDQEYFADGITNDLITDLSKFRDLFVIASNSVFAYKGKPASVQQIGRELGVRFVLKGSVQRQGERVRINVRLIDAGSGKLLWAERYDEAISNLFDLQDKITRTITRTLAVKLSRFEQERAVSKKTQDLAAYDYVLRGRKLMHNVRRTDNFAARKMFQQAIARDANYAAAYAGLGRTYHEAVLYGWTESPQNALKRANDLARKAIALDADSVAGHALLASVYLIRRQYDQALIESERAIALNPNDARLHAHQGTILVWSGRPKGAILALETALRFDPLMGARPLTHLGTAYYLTGRFADAVRVLERAVGPNPDYAHGQTMLAAAYGQLGKQAEARRAADIVRRLDPFFATGHFGRLFRNPADAAAIIDGLHKAGLE